jgi:hypothetical protein
MRINIVLSFFPLVNLLIGEICMRKIRYIIFSLILCAGASLLAAPPKHNYGSSSVYDKYGRTSGRITSRTNSAAKYREYTDRAGNRTTIRTPNTGTSRNTRTK